MTFWRLVGSIHEPYKTIQEPAHCSASWHHIAQILQHHAPAPQPSGHNCVLHVVLSALIMSRDLPHCKHWCILVLWFLNVRLRFIAIHKAAQLSHQHCTAGDPWWSILVILLLPDVCLILWILISLESNTTQQRCSEPPCAGTLPRTVRPQVNPIDILGAEEISLASAPNSSRLQVLGL